MLDIVSFAQFRWQQKPCVSVGHRLLFENSCAAAHGLTTSAVAYRACTPTLLSKRLSELEAAGVIVSIKGTSGSKEYQLTKAGDELRPIVMGIGAWGQRWVESELSLNNLDPELLIWDCTVG